MKKKVVKALAIVLLSVFIFPYQVCAIGSCDIEQSVDQSKQIEAVYSSTALNTSQRIYMINKDAGQFVFSTGSTAQLRSGTIGNLGSAIQWNLTELSDGTYTIQSVSDPTLYLAAASGQGSTRIFLISLTDNQITDRFKWRFIGVNGGGVLVQNVNTQKYLRRSGITLSSLPSVDNSSDSAYNSFVWLYTPTDYYGNSDAFEKQEWSTSCGFKTCTLFTGGTQDIEFLETYSSVLWATLDFFTFSGYDTNYVDFDGDSYTFTSQVSANTHYRAIITATHKLTGLSTSFWLVVNPYVVTVGVSNSGHNHSTCLVDIKDNLKNCGYFDVSNYTGAFIVSDISNYLDDDKNNVYISRSHGAKIFNANDQQVGTGIVLNDNENAIIIFSEDHLRNLELSNMTLIMFIGCFTGSSGSNGDNLPAVAVECGCQTAVGFTSEIVCLTANTWTRQLISRLEKGETIEEAVLSLSSNILFYPAGFARDEVVIYGDADMTLN